MGRAYRPPRQPARRLERCAQLLGEALPASLVLRPQALPALALEDAVDLVLVHRPLGHDAYSAARVLDPRHDLGAVAHALNAGEEPLVGQLVSGEAPHCLVHSVIGDGPTQRRPSISPATRPARRSYSVIRRF